MAFLPLITAGAARVIACIEDQRVFERILAHLRDKEKDIPTLPLLTPPPRAPPETLLLFAGSESKITMLNQQERWKTSWQALLRALVQ